MIIVKVIIINGGIMECYIIVLFFCIGCGGFLILILFVGLWWIIFGEWWYVL